MRPSGTPSKITCKGPRGRAACSCSLQSAVWAVMPAEEPCGAKPRPLASCLRRHPAALTSHSTLAQHSFAAPSTAPSIAPSKAPLASCWRGPEQAGLIPLAIAATPAYSTIHTRVCPSTLSACPLCILAPSLRVLAYRSLSMPRWPPSLGRSLQGLLCLPSCTAV